MDGSSALDRRRALLVALGVLATPPAARAQSPPRVHRIGYRGPGHGSTLPAALEAFRQELRTLGYVEGQNLSMPDRPRHP